MDSILTLVPPKYANAFILGLPALGILLSIARTFVSNNSKAAAIMDKILGLLPLDMHKAANTSKQ